MINLNEEQKAALEILRTNQRCFLTGQAGVGKTTLVNEFMQNKRRWKFPVLASTGMAAILAGGRTLHSFFGIGIMEGGKQATIERAIDNDLVFSRLSYTEGILIDEISMVSADTLDVIEEIARECRGNDEPWGGLKVIAVGDFHQLPPVNPHKEKRVWAFESEAWKNSNFKPVVLNTVMRSKNDEFIEVLNFIRKGTVNRQVIEFMDDHVSDPGDNFSGTRLFGRRSDVESYNLRKLRELPGPEYRIDTKYDGKDEAIVRFKKNSPIPDVLRIRDGALVMVRVNDPDGNYVNGSLGHVLSVSSDAVCVELLSGPIITLERKEFSLLDAQGDPQVTACNFPLMLAYAVTIHKAQGATMDRVLIDLDDLWECGQCYVALSRVRSPEGLYLKRWSPQSVIVDKTVTKFYEKMNEN